jgi:hypothetical protein
MGSLAAGSAAVLGTGASNTFNVQDRQAKINITADGSTGVIGVVDKSAGDIVNVTDDTLEIDFAEYTGSDGVPVDSVVELGDTRSGTSAIPEFGSPSFGVANYAAGQDIELDFNITTGSNFNVVSGGSAVRFGGYFFDDSVNPLMQMRPFESQSGSGGAGNAVDEKSSVGVFNEDTHPGENLFFRNPTGSALSPGDTLNMALEVDTRGGAEEEDVSMDIDIIARSV